MPVTLHLIIPDAAPRPGAGASPSGPPPMPPSLRALLAAMVPCTRIDCTEDSPSTPCELALAAAHNLPGEPGYIPWAAFETGTAGLPCAFVKLCHLQVGADHILLSPAESLTVDPETSSALMAAMAPYFLEDGITLRAHGVVPGTWLATGEPFRHLRTLSTDQLAGRQLTRSMLEAAGKPADGSAALLRRLQNEMQMLLYTHPVNEARQQQRLLPVNSFWVSGAGVLETKISASPQVRVESRLRAASLSANPNAHAAAWQQVDADSCAELLARLRAGEPVRLTLCGKRAAQTFEPGKTGFLSRFKHILGLQPNKDVREQL